MREVRLWMERGEEIVDLGVEVVIGGLDSGGWGMVEKV